MPIISLLSPERLKVVISIAVTSKIMRLDEGSQISNAIKDVEESVCKIDSFRSAVEEIISLGEALISNAPAVVKAATDELKDVLKKGPTTGTPAPPAPGSPPAATPSSGTGGSPGSCPVGQVKDPITGACVGS